MGVSVDAFRVNGRLGPLRQHLDFLPCVCSVRRAVLLRTASWRFHFIVFVRRGSPRDFR